MGIESDRLVFDYLSRVGDLAQQQQLPSSARMRLVAELRDEIDRHRSKASTDSPASVRRILSRIGDPDELVAQAGTGARPATDGTPLAVPEQRTVQAPPPPPADPLVPKPGEPQDPPGPDESAGRPTAKSLWGLVPRPRKAAAPHDVPPTLPPGLDDDHRAPAPPHLAPLDELGSPSGNRDWWRVDTGPREPFDSVPGFVGGIEIPEILKPPPATTDPKDDAPEPAAGAPAAQDTAPLAPATTPGTRAARALLTGWSNPLLLLAVALLVFGALAGNLLALAGGWAIAWLSRRLTPAESQFAVVWLPGLSLAGGVLWLWGRAAGHWGPKLVDERFDEAIGETWPWVLKSAALASAAFLLWRSQRKS
ncbi:hypothetical protein [Streptomyces sp. NPDC002490]|uniref:hypothetical protein n=1 Tax=Streptomyces sp. NPDC002490 TaxID=3154416 RepID=UPI00331DB1CF